MRLVLPYRCRRAGLAAFGAVMGLWGAIVVGVVMPLGPVRPMPRAGVALLAGVLIAGAFRGLPREAEMLYRVWVRASRLYAKIARRVLLMLCHGVISVVALTGTSLVLARPAAGHSLWQAREALPTAVYGSQFDASAPGWAGRPWRALIDWAIRSRNVWLVCLVPFLALVAMLDTEERGRYPDGIYTLF
jgi:hypothetical protein